MVELGHYVYAALGVLLLYYIYTSTNAYWRLRHFKGPLIAGWSDLWYIRAAVSGRAHLYLSEVNTKYGPLARIGPNTLVTSDEELYKRMNTPRSGYYKHDFYKAFRFGAEVENVFSETDNVRHAYLRKRVASGYSGRDNPDLESDMDAVILTMVKSWKERYISDGSITKKMDLAQQIQYLTLDMITSLSLSEPFGWVSTDSDLYEYNKIMSANMPIMFFTSAVPVISRMLRVRWIARSIAPSVKDRVGMGKIKAVSTKIIADRFSEMRERPHQSVKKDMTTSFISHKLTESEIADGALLALVAGSDTSASVIRTGLCYILTQPRIIQRLQKECDHAGIPNNKIISYTQALELPYLQACVKESVRIGVVATGLSPRIVPPEGDYYDGKFIPGGTVIGQCAWNLHRLNFAAYGPDADIFRPERWIEATEAAATGSPQRLERMEESAQLAFGYGEFKCLGYKVALIEISKILFEVVRRFDLGFIDGMTPIASNKNWGLFVQEGMWVRVEERSISI